MNPRCPGCSRRALRFRKRTDDYSCSRCPFVGPRGEVEAAEEARQRVEEAERARSRAESAADLAEMEAEELALEREEARRTVLTFVEEYVDLAGPGEPKSHDFGLGTLALVAIPSGAGGFFGAGAIVAASTFVRALGLLGFILAFAGVFIILFAALAIAAAFVLSHLDDRAKAESEATWHQNHPEFEGFRAKSLDPGDLGDPETLAFVKGLALDGLRVFGRSGLDAENRSEVREALRTLDRSDVSPTGGSYRDVG
jgi:hypothetical protein